MLTCMEGVVAVERLAGQAGENNCSEQMEIYLLQAVEVVFHAFYGYIFAVLDALCLEHLRKGTFTFLGY